MISWPWAWPSNVGIDWINSSSFSNLKYVLHMIRGGNGGVSSSSLSLIVNFILVRGSLCLIIKMRVHQLELGQIWACIKFFRSVSHLGWWFRSFEDSFEKVRIRLTSLGIGWPYFLLVGRFQVIITWLVVNINQIELIKLKNFFFQNGTWECKRELGNVKWEMKNKNRKWKLGNGNEI